MRMQLFDVLKMPSKARFGFKSSGGIHRVLEPFTLNGVTFDTQGDMHGAV